jgi:hypothetical protein
MVWRATRHVERPESGDAQVSVIFVFSRLENEVLRRGDRGGDSGQKDSRAEILGRGLTGTRDWAAWFWWMGGL